MSFSVGSLADLISGSGSSGEKNDPLSSAFGATGQKVIFRQVATPKKAKSAPEKPAKAAFPEQLSDPSVSGSFVSPGRLTRPPRKSSNLPQTPQTPQRDPEQEARTVFVGNLPGTVQKKDMVRLFRQFGPVETVRFRCAAVPDSKTSKKVAVIKRTFHSERTSIAAYVRLETRASAEEALKLNGTQFKENYIRVDLADNPAKGDNKKAVFVGNLPFGVEENDLWTFFEECGKISFVRVIRDSKSGIGMGYGFVNFDSTQSAEAALKKNGAELRERALVVERYARKPRHKVAVVVEDTRKKKKMKGDGLEGRKVRKEEKKKKGWREREGKMVVFRKEKKRKVKEEGSERVAEVFEGEATNVEGKKKKRKARMNKEQRKKKRVAKMLAAL